MSVYRVPSEILQGSPRTRVCFNTSIPCREQPEASCPGRELASWLAAALREEHVRAGHVSATVWSWSFAVLFGDAQAVLHVVWQRAAEFSHIHQDWALLINEPIPSIIGPLFGAKHQPLAARAKLELVQTIHEILQRAQFSEVRWYQDCEWAPDSTAAGHEEPLSERPCGELSSEPLVASGRSR